MSLHRGQGLFEQAADKIRRYNQLCLHYNLVADAVYQKLHSLGSPFSPSYEAYLIAALTSFEMERMMGKGAEQRYDASVAGFAARLHSKLLQIRPHLEAGVKLSLAELKVEQHAPAIAAAYRALAAGGEAGLNSKGNRFHVGATKILHFLNPESFAIIDANTAKTHRRVCGVPYIDTTLPGYSSSLYIRSLSAIKDLIATYGLDRFRSLEHGTPTLRIFDKIAFAHASFAPWGKKGPAG